MTRPLPTRWGKIASICALAALFWLNSGDLLSRILYPGDRYPSASTWFGRYEAFSVAAASNTRLAIAAGSQISTDRQDFTAAISLFDRTNRQRRWQTELNTPPSFRSVNALLWSPDDRQVVANDTDGYVTVLDATTGRLLRQLSVHTYRPCIFGFVTGGLLLTERDTPRGQTFLALRSWPALTPVWRVPLDCFDAATGNTDRSGTLAAIALDDGRRLGLFDLRTRTFRTPVLQVPDTRTVQHALSSLSIRPDGQQVAGGEENGALVVWDARTGQVRWDLHPHGDLVRAVSRNPSGDALASSAFGGCGWPRSECVVVTRFRGVSPGMHVAWNHQFNSPGSVGWLNGNTLLLSEYRNLVTVSSGLPEP